LVLLLLIVLNSVAAPTLDSELRTPQ